MIIPESPKFEDEFEQEIITKEQRFENLKNLLSQDSDFKARLAVRNLQVAPYIPANIPAGMGLIGQDIMEVDPRLIDNISRQVTAENKTLWSSFTDTLKGVGRGAFVGFDAGLDFVKGQLLSRFPVEIGQRYSDKRSEGKTSSQAVREIFNEFDDIREKVGDTAFTLAIRSALKGEEINLGQGIIPLSTPIEDTDEYKELVDRGVNPDTALGIAEQMVGAPITQIAREQARTGVQFRGETAAGLTARGEVPFVTLGRIFTEPLVAMDIVEPGTKGYRNISGSVDFVGTLALDPANWLLFGAGAAAKGAKSIKYLDEAAKAKAISEMGGITGGIRKTMLTRFPRLGGYSVEGFLQSNKGKNLNKFLSSSNDIDAPAGNIDTLSSLLKSDDFDQLGKIARSSGDESEMFGLLRDFFAGNLGERIPFSTKLFDSYKLGRNANRTSQMFNKIIKAPEDLAQFGVGPSLRYTNKWSPIVRLFSKLYNTGYDPSDMKTSFITLKNMMRQMDLPVEDRSRIMREFVDNVEGLNLADDVLMKEATLVDEVAWAASVDPIGQIPKLKGKAKLERANIIFKANAEAVKAWRFKLLDELGEVDILPDLKKFRELIEIDSTDIAKGKKALASLKGKKTRLEKAGEVLKNEDIAEIKRLETLIATKQGLIKSNQARIDNLLQDSLPQKVVDKITNIYEKEFASQGLNFVDEQGNAFELGTSFKAFVNDEVVDIPSFRLETELAQNYIPTIPPATIVKATNILKKDFLGRNPLKNVKSMTALDDGAIDLILDKYITSVWKPAVLLRGAWTVRVIGEEQIRMWARGYNGLVSPNRWIAMMTGKELDPTGTLKILKKIDEGLPDSELNNYLFREFPDLPKRFSYNGEQITPIQAIRMYMDSGDRKLLEVVELTSKDMEVMTEFFDAISGAHKGWLGLKRSNPSLAAKSFAIFGKENRRGYISSLQVEYEQLLKDTLAKKILADGVAEAKKFLWVTRNDKGSLAQQIAKQDDFFSGILRDQDFSNKIVDYVNARIHIKTGGKVNKDTLEIIETGSESLLSILRTGTYKGNKLSNNNKVSQKQYTEMFDEFNDVLPDFLKGRGNAYTDFAKRGEVGAKLDDVIDNLFYVFMTMPTNKLSRAPVFKQAYWNKVKSLIGSSDETIKSMVIAQAEKSNVSKKLIKEMKNTKAASREKALFKAEIKSEGLTMREIAAKGKGKLAFEDYATPKKAFDALDETAKAHALSETKKLLYDLSERTRFWEATRFIFPFGEAYQEIITTWARILKDNPAPVRRFQLTIEKGRETNPFNMEDTDRGFFYQDPTTGEEMFSWGVWGGLASRFMGFQDDDPIQLEASGFAKSVNLVGQSFLPGVGPVVQVPASFFTRNMDPESTIVQAIYGDFPPPPVDNPIKHIYNIIPVPSWLKKFLQAYELGSDEYIRLQTNTTIDVYNALYYAGRVSDNSYEEFNEGMELAKEYAKTLTLIRSLSTFIGPTGFSNRFKVLADTPEGRKIIFVAAMADEYREKRDEVFNGDEFATTQYFIQEYGIDPTALLVGKTAQVYRTPVTIEGSKWYRENEEIFKQYKSTAYFAKPDDPTGEFSYESYLKSLQNEDRVPLTVEEWRLTRNNILGSLAWESFMLSSAPGHKPYWLRSDDQSVTDKETKRMELKKQYPGWGYGSVPGIAKGKQLDAVIEEFYQWENNEVLSNSEAGKGLSMYIKARETAKMESVRLGYSANGFRNARSLTNVRLYLTDYANYVISQYPDFQYIWNSYFKRELLEAEQDEQIKLARANY